MASKKVRPRSMVPVAMFQAMPSWAILDGASSAGTGAISLLQGIPNGDL